MAKVTLTSQVLSFMQGKGTFTLKQIAAHLKADEDAVRSAANNLKRAGKISKTNNVPRGFHQPSLWKAL